ncbi:MAG: MFS transporter [Caldisericaceae bacterium]
MKIEYFLSSRIETRIQRKLLFVTSLFWAFAAAGVMVMSLTLPRIASSYNIDLVKASLIPSFTFVGMLVGATTFGNFADIAGRKIMIAIAIALIGIFNFATGIKMSFSMLLLARFFAGIGMGGALPVINAYLAEFSPSSLRGRNLVLLEASWAVGSIIIGIIAITFGKNNYQIDYFVFLAGLLMLLIIPSMPESIKFLVKKNRKESLKNNLEKVGINDEINFEFEVEETRRIPLANLFTREYLGRTLMIWYLWFSVSFAYYGFFSWLPKVISKMIGTTVTASTMYVFTMLVMQLPGYLLAAYFVEKIGRKKTLFISLLGTAIMAFLFAQSKTSTVLLVNGALMTSFCMSAWGVIYAYTPELYPTEFRASANGSAGSLARVAGIIAPIYIASLFRNLILAISVLGVMLLLGAVWTLAKGKETKNVEIG